jgi:hypothetical protein
MSRWHRRYEILLPLRFDDDGEAVPDDLIGTTLLELEQRIGASGIAVVSQSQAHHAASRRPRGHVQQPVA